VLITGLLPSAVDAREVHRGGFGAYSRSRQVAELVGPADCRAAQATQRQLAGTNLTPPHAGTLAARVVITHRS
jgi:hypothetical protein